MKEMAGDLTKTVVVTILALILQVSLAVYLNSGGWEKIINMLKISVITS